MKTGKENREKNTTNVVSGPRICPPPVISTTTTSPEPDRKDVIELTEANWQEKVLNSEKGILVEFYAPWCGHCQRLAGPWADAASQLKGKMDLGALDGTVYDNILDQYRVTGYPTIKYFAPGATQPENYIGSRTASGIVRFAEEKLAEILAPPEVLDNCTLPGRVCLRGGSDHEGNIYIGLGSRTSKPVCDDSWDIKDGIVVCRELGYHGIVKVRLTISFNFSLFEVFCFLKVTKQSRYGRVSSDFGADNVVCTGNENHLAECSYNSQDDCSESEGAGVVCDTRPLEEIENERRTCFEDGVSYDYGEYLDFNSVVRLVGEKKIIFV